MKIFSEVHWTALRIVDLESSRIMPGHNCKVSPNRPVLKSLKSNNSRDAVRAADRLHQVLVERFGIIRIVAGHARIPPNQHGRLLEVICCARNINLIVAGVEELIVDEKRIEIG